MAYDATKPADNEVLSVAPSVIRANFVAIKSEVEGKAASSHTHNQSDSHGTPDTDSATTALHHTIGTGANQAAAGNHTHAQSESHGSADTDSATTSLHHTIGTGANQAAAGNHNHSGTYEPANANIQSHVMAVTGNPHGVTKSDVGLGSVSNDAQLKIASNLSDLNSAETARGNLGLGDSATKSVGSTSGTVAAGDHSHSGYEPANANIQSHISAVTGNPHAVTKSDVGLGNVPNVDCTNASNLASGTVPIERLPPAAIERLVIVADETARFALTTATVQNGDTVKENDTGFMYFVYDDANLDSGAGYKAYTAGLASAVEWSGVTSKPTTVSGYGITDGVTDSALVSALNELQMLISMGAMI